MVEGREVVVGGPASVQGFALDALRDAIAPGQMAVCAAIDARSASALLASDRLRDTAAATCWWWAAGGEAGRPARCRARAPAISRALADASAEAGLRPRRLR